MSIFFISPAFAEPVDVEIDWTIEGQTKTIVNPSISEPINQNQDNDVNTFNEKIQKKSLEVSAEIEEFEDLVTGRGYTLGTKLMTMDSEEGKILNQVRLEQRQINKDNFFEFFH